MSGRRSERKRRGSSITSRTSKTNGTREKVAKKQRPSTNRASSSSNRASLVSNQRPTGSTQNRSSRNGKAAKSDKKAANEENTKPDEGCLICGIDDNYNKLMLCEKCDGEYHIYCLNPPLAAVPKGAWFCAKCSRKKGKNPQITPNRGVAKARQPRSNSKDSSGPAYLDGKTFSLLKKYVLESRPEDELNEDDVCLQMERVNRSAEQIRNRNASKRHGAENDAEPLFEKVRTIEESIIFGRDFFHNAVSEVQRNGRVSTDRRTLAWLKRATGIHRAAKRAAPSGEDAHANQRTRGKARDVRKQNDDEGLEVLLSAVDSLGIETGKVGSPSERKRHWESLKSNGDQNYRGDDTPKRRRKDTIYSDGVKLKSNFLSKLHDRWREQFPAGRTDSSLEEDIYAKSPRLSSSLQKNGVIVKPPRLDWFANSETRLGLQPPKGQYSYRSYAKPCLQIINSLQGRGRLWVACEFFYSDIDKAWYSDRACLNEKLQSVGIDSRLKFSGKEWKAVRKLVHGSGPRRFSQKFIESELKQLDFHRKEVRMHQISLFTGDNGTAVPPLISPGTFVTAFSRRFGMIHRARVLSHDPILSEYLVQFENKNFGQELCPDYEVARSQVLDKQEPSLPPSVPHKASRKQVLGALLLGKHAMTEVVSRPAVENAAEYEAFVNLLSALDSVKLRKSKLLAAGSAVIARMKAAHDDPAEKELLQNCHTWLFENIAATNDAIKSLLCTLRDLYGEAYLTCQERYADKPILISCQLHHALVSAFLTPVYRFSSAPKYESMSRAIGREREFCFRQPTTSRKWVGTLVGGAKSVSAKIERAEEDDSSAGKQSNSQSAITAACLAAMGQTITTAAFGYYSCGESNAAELTALEVAFDLGAKEVAAKAGNQRLEWTNNAIYDDILKERDAASKTFSDSVALYKSEVALARVTHECAS